MDHLIYQRKGGLNELSEAMCTVFQVDKNHSFHYVVHYTSKHFSLATGELISESIQRKSIAPLKQPCSRWWSICLFPSYKKPLSIVNCFDPKQCLKILKCCQNVIRLSRSPSFRPLNCCTWNLADISLLTIHGFRATFVSWYIIQLLKFHELLQGMYELRNLFVVMWALVICEVCVVWLCTIWVYVTFSKSGKDKQGLGF